MTANQILNADAHKHLSLVGTCDIEKENVLTTNCSIIADEIFAASGSFPIVLMKDDLTNKFILSAIFCLQSERNNFYQGNTWLAPYTPLNLQRQPFSLLLEREGDTERASPVIDVDSSLLAESGGQRLFLSDGSPSETLLKKLKVLEALDRGRLRTERLIDSLVGLDLIKAIKIKLATEDATRWVSGLYGIDIEKLNQNDEAIIARLRTLGVLEDALMMKASFSQLGRLVWMENKGSVNPVKRYDIVVNPSLA